MDEVKMSMKELAEVIHQNAVKHGWWEEDRLDAEVRALIHSEWSEALEEARAGRPLEWFMCKMQIPANCCCEDSFRCAWKEKMGDQGCPVRGEKPEGSAVELIDGVIRILDWMAHEKTVDWDLFEIHMGYAEQYCKNYNGRKLQGLTVPDLVDVLHFFTAGTSVKGEEDFAVVVGIVFEWIRARGMEPEAILMRKHRYNTTRPYKHGKKF